MTTTKIFRVSAVVVATYCQVAAARYLQPEPLVQSPTYAARMALNGLSVPTYSYALNNPIRFVDVDGLKPGDRFTGQWSQNQAAVDALRWIKGQSDREQVEYGGMVCVDTATGEHFATSAQTDNSAIECSPEKSPCPKGSKPVGKYHTHVAAGGSRNAEQFSSWDMIGARSESTLSRRLDQYLSTVSGNVLKYHPHNKGFGDTSSGTVIWSFNR